MKKFTSSSLQIEVGQQLISKAEYQSWWQRNAVALKRQACDSIYNSLNSQESLRVRREMEAAGVVYVDPITPDYSTAPEPWEIEQFESKPSLGGGVLVTIRKPRDEHSWHRLHLFESELFEAYTGQSVDQLVERDLEQVKSLWARKAEQIKRADVATRTEEIVEKSTDELSKAAYEVAKFEQASNGQRADMMSNPSYRSKLLAAKRAVSAARSFQ